MPPYRVLLEEWPEYGEEVDDTTSEEEDNSAPGKEDNPGEADVDNLRKEKVNNVHTKEVDDSRNEAIENPREEDMSRIQNSKKLPSQSPRSKLHVSKDEWVDSSSSEDETVDVAHQRSPSLVVLSDDSDSQATEPPTTGKEKRKRISELRTHDANGSYYSNKRYRNDESSLLFQTAVSRSTDSLQNLPTELGARSRRRGPDVQPRRQRGNAIGDQVGITRKDEDQYSTHPAAVLCRYYRDHRNNLERFFTPGTRATRMQLAVRYANFRSTLFGVR